MEQKKQNRIAIILISAIVLIVIAVGIATAFFNKKDEEQAPKDVDKNQIERNILNINPEEE